MRAADLWSRRPHVLPRDLAEMLWMYPEVAVDVEIVVARRPVGLERRVNPSGSRHPSTRPARSAPRSAFTISLRLDCSRDHRSAPPCAHLCAIRFLRPTAGSFPFVFIHLLGSLSLLRIHTACSFVYIFPPWSSGIVSMSVHVFVAFSACLGAANCCIATTSSVRIL